jgi:hypothetical protein
MRCKSSYTTIGAVLYLKNQMHRYRGDKASRLYLTLTLLDQQLRGDATRDDRIQSAREHIGKAKPG